MVAGLARRSGWNTEAVRQFSSGHLIAGLVHEAVLGGSPLWLRRLRFVWVITSWLMPLVMHLNPKSAALGTCEVYTP